MGHGTNQTFNCMTERQELHLFRTSQLDAAAFQAAEHEPPKEVERAEDCEPYVRCKFCHNHCMPNAAVCLDCWDGPEE